jgi:hypothetical protein
LTAIVRSLLRRLLAGDAALETWRASVVADDRIPAELADACVDAARQLAAAVARLDAFTVTRGDRS